MGAERAVEGVDEQVTRGAVGGKEERFAVIRKFELRPLRL